MGERAILAARNKDVDSFNFNIQSKIAGELRSYKSVDSTTDENEAVNYPTEFLNSLDVPGTPPHNLQVKVGSIIIMLRNLNPPKLCNGTRLSVKKLRNNVIQSTIIKGKFKREEVLIPRIPIIPTDLPFQFKRIQFPVRVAFAMTINKSQGQYRWKSVGSIWNFHVFRKGSCTLAVRVLADHLRCLFLHQKTKRKTLFIKMHSTDFCNNLFTWNS
ncbi:uncharacterized protein LOC132947750 [Metopolophium dirhodum]|uniref:uncharacterized protein LOC132947750 n=1 Tax=Metopolophium dirhodum TaxID=44670 RepID=UPI00298FE056|nr:uncharacterized protein LOC132947750 [Metopolophium dirhodum]